jgi:pimeloyl-ACP methyl ester carboxylesterase
MRSMIHWYRAIVQHPPPPPGSSRIEPPTRIIWGAKDPFLGRELAWPSLDLCDNGELVFIESATHWVQHEEPEQVNRLLLDFFTKS